MFTRAAATSAAVGKCRPASATACKSSEVNDLTDGARARLLEHVMRGCQILWGNSEGLVERDIIWRAPSDLGAICHFADLGEDVFGLNRSGAQGLQILAAFVDG